MLNMWKRSVALVVILLLTLSTVPAASAEVPFVGMGDSIGEGVQSGDASESTQPFNFLNLIALRLGTSFPLPLIRTSIFGTVGDTSTRSRINPNVAGLDLAVSGADVSSILRDRADATSPALINSETDLVLFPRLGSQIEIAETLRPNLVACWIGNNDVLGAVTSFDQMDLSQMTIRRICRARRALEGNEQQSRLRNDSRCGQYRVSGRSKLPAQQIRYWLPPGTLWMLMPIGMMSPGRLN